MAPATYNVTTSRTDLQGLWRIYQGVLREATNFLFPEWDDLKDFQNVKVDWSFRSITAPLDINEGVGVASIPEGGYEARPSSPTVVEASWTWIHLNKRITVSKISKMIQQKDRSAMLADQFKFQGKKAIEAIGQYIADSFYGFSTGVRGKVSALANNTTTAITVTLKDAYGVTGLGNTASGGAPIFVSTLFRQLEWVAFIRAGALVANSIGQITTMTPATPSMIVTFAVAPTLAVNDDIVFANSTENTTIAGTDYGASLVGFLEALTSTTVHGVSSGTYAKWAPQYADTAAGRFTTMNFRRMKQAISQYGGGEMTDLRISLGVENDILAQLQAGVQFTDMNNLQLDGDFKAKGVTIKSTRHMLPGFAIGYDKSAIRKMVLLPNDPKAPTWEDGEKIPDRSMYAFSIDYPLQMVWLNRAQLAYSSNKTEQ